MLTEEQMCRICGILGAGCDRETAAGVVECSVVDVNRAIADLPGFAIRVRRAEATAEWRHMENILNTTKDRRYWRASVWWLERRSPERFARRPANALTPHQLEQAVIILNDTLQLNFNSPEDQQRISTCLDQITTSFKEALDAQCAATLIKRQGSLLRIEHAAPQDADVSVDGEAVPSSDAT